MSGEMPLWQVFGRIGVLSFGGPAAQIALMHRELVDTRRWLSEAEYLRALSFCMLLPGPEAMQLATYAGWKLGGIRGGLIAGLLFVLPGAMVICALAAAYVAFGNLAMVSAAFLGIKAAVVVIVIEALLRVARRTLATRLHWLIALAAFVALFWADLPYPAVIVAAAACGAVFLAAGTAATSARPENPGLVRTLALGLTIWWLPVGMLALGGQDFLVSVSLFFSRLAVVTFGGAYAVLAYMTQTVVQDFGWLTTAEMMDALGLAETTPGPLILVTEFVGFLAGHSQGGTGLALAAAALTLWVTFVPCFIWVFAFAPYVEWIGTRPRLTAALSGVTAAVVGVIASLALWFGLTLFFPVQQVHSVMSVDVRLPDLASTDLKAVAISLLAAVLVLRWHVNLIAVLAVSCVAGILAQSFL